MVAFEKHIPTSAVHVGPICSCRHIDFPKDRFVYAGYHIVHVSVHGKSEKKTTDDLPVASHKPEQITAKVLNDSNSTPT